jgi:hypothetical protein
MPENERFPFSRDDAKSCLDRTVIELDYFCHTALQKSAFLLADSSTVASDP